MCKNNSAPDRESGAAVVSTTFEEWPFMVEAQPTHEQPHQRSRPARSVVDFDAIPVELRDRPNWVLWRYESRGEKWTKVPYRVLGGAFRRGEEAQSNSSASWTTFGAARRAYENDDSADGVGFVFDGQGIFGVDLDKALDDAGAVKEWAKPIVESLNSYTETTPSGQGLHIIGRGSWDGRGTRRPRGDGEVEAYQVGRFFTMTGRLFGEYPRAIEERTAQVRALISELRPAPTPQSTPLSLPQEERTPRRVVVPPTGLGFPGDDDRLIVEAMEARNGAKFRKLWEGDTNGYRSPSEGDLALANLIAFWTGPDPVRLERIFSRSDLGQREKWKARADYREDTVQQALAGRVDFYSPRPKRAEAPKPGDDRGYLRAALGVEIDRVEKFAAGVDRAEYVVVLADGRSVVVGTASQMLSQTRVRAAFFEAAKVVVPHTKEWDQVAAALAALVIERAAGDSDEREVLGWILDWIGSRMTDPSVDLSDARTLATVIDAAVSRERNFRGFFFGNDDRLYVHAERLKWFLVDRIGKDAPTITRLRKRLAMLGFASVRLSARNGADVPKCYFWRSEPGFDPATALEALDGRRAEA